MIQYSVSDGSGNFLTESQTLDDEVILPAGEVSDSVAILIGTESDITDESDGEIVVTLKLEDGDQPSYLV